VDNRANKRGGKHGRIFSPGGLGDQFPKGGKEKEEGGKEKKRKIHAAKDARSA